MTEDILGIDFRYTSETNLVELWAFAGLGNVTGVT